jgi:hypothetical protein
VLKRPEEKISRQDWRPLFLAMEPHLVLWFISSVTYYETVTLQLSVETAHPVLS